MGSSDFLKALFQIFAIGNDRGLGGGPRAEAPSKGAAVIIGGGFLARVFGHGAADVHLPLETRPEKGEGGARVRGEFAGFAALVIGVKAKAPFIDCFQQDNAGGGLARGIDGGQSHGVGLCDEGGDGLVKPSFELLERVRVEVAAAQARPRVFGAQIGNLHGRKNVRTGASGRKRIEAQRIA